MRERREAVTHMLDALYQNTSLVELKIVNQYPTFGYGTIFEFSNEGPLRESFILMDAENMRTENGCKRFRAYPECTCSEKFA
jgi:hypothetical protein